MKTTLLTILTITILTSVEAIEVYKTYLGGSKTCYIYFYGDDNYEITILSNSIAIDIVLNFFFSKGRYHQEGDELFLHDNYNDFELQFKKHDDKLIPIKSFIFLKNNTFEKPGRYEYIDKPYSQRAKIKMSSLEERIGTRSTNAINEISLEGTYRGTYRFQLLLTEDFHYKYWFEGLLVSKGTWSREDNTLRLEDEVLNHSFTIVVMDDDHLVNLFFPDPQSIHLYKDNFPQPYINIQTETHDRSYKDF